MFRYGEPDDIQKLTLAILRLSLCSYYKLQMFWREGLKWGEIRIVALDKMESTHTPQSRRGGSSVTTEYCLLHLIMPRRHKDTERAPKC